MTNVDIAIIGGSGFYQLLDKAKEIKIETPYGFPSDKIAVGEMTGRQVIFLPRHGKHHQFPPHKIPYKANLWALKKLGVQRIISLTACGSLQKQIKRGDFVVIDQFVDRTSGRQATFFDGPKTVHISTAYPYCPEINKIAYEISLKQGLRVHRKGTLVIVEGPRFSTKAESEWFTKMGWDIINMTGYPEVALAKELEICYSSIAIVTDYDVGIVAWEKLPPVSTDEIMQVFGENIAEAKKLVREMIKKIPKSRTCECGDALKEARI
ncbi:MAG: S-methyl-5'-thioadenosine phosphorylase [Patescibacteria group bacterium]|nr:S-methyl-5'-thioadenosine phosphorylase [Patescibacteria group bacterium]MCL5095499.1 S-methyl-5'-thioadenosine phosphorylase [Patescibacteria group bacterium]